MNELLPIYKDQRKIDANHLTLLSIFHFVGAGLAIFGILLIVAHYAFMHALLGNPKIWQNQKQGPPPAEFFAVFKWFYLIFGVWFLASLVFNVISGLCIRAKKYRVFSLFVAGVNCLHIPLGTVLGVFTIIILARDSVQELYRAEAR